jgi:hypothetical protein
MDKKPLIGIFIFMLFLFSTFPAVIGGNHDNNIEKSSYIIGFRFQFLQGKIEYLGESVVYNTTCYNITNFNLKFTEINFWFGSGFDSWSDTLVGDTPYLIPKDLFSHGFVHNNFLFLWSFKILTDYDTEKVLAQEPYDIPVGMS